MVVRFHFSDPIFLTFPMPITGPPQLQPVTQDEFARLDYQVMRLAFESQNQLGRLCEEAVYQEDLLARLRVAGIPADKEVSVKVGYRDFSKTYLLDLVVGQVGVYELKAAAALVGAHEAQLLQYLFLCGAHHGKLINFRSAQVESRFINVRSTPAERRQFTVEPDGWRERDSTDRVFRECLLGLLDDWGGWLDVDLYTEALVHCMKGEGLGAQRLPMTREGVFLGTQSFHLLSPETAFRISALHESTANLEHSLRSLLSLSPLRVLHWINLGRSKIQLISLTK
jgi:hypothetical protein